MLTHKLQIALALGTSALLSSTGAQALSLTVNTTWLDANGVISLSMEAQQALQLTGIQVSAGGKSTNLGGGRFNLPITQLSADVGLFTLTPISGQVDGSALIFDNGFSGKRVSIEGLQIDFSSNAIVGDIVVGGAITPTTLFTFDVTSPLRFNVKGGVSLTEHLGNLRMSTAAANTFADGIGLPSYLSTVLTSIDFGSVDATIRPWFRTPVKAVPEAGTGSLMALGLMGLLAWRHGMSPARSRT